MKVAFIGLGTMGSGMARNILHAGHELTVFNRTREKEESLAAAGASRAATPKAAAAGAELIVTCVSDTPDVRELVLGENGVIHGAAPGSLLADMSTISPSATREMAALLTEKGIGMIDAPVTLRLKGSVGQHYRSSGVHYGHQDLGTGGISITVVSSESNHGGAEWIDIQFVTGERDCAAIVRSASF